MNVFQLISSGGCYGAETMLLTLAGQLQRLGCRVTVGVFHNDTNPHTEVAARAAAAALPVVVIPCRGRADRGAVARIREQLAGQDVLHTHGYKSDLYGYAASRRPRVPVISTFHNWASETVALRAYALLDRLVLARLERIVVVAPTVGNSLRATGIARRKISFIPNGIEVERFADAVPTLFPGGAKPGPVVGMVARLIPEKGPRDFLLAAAAVLRRHPAARFVLVGDGPERARLEALAAETGIGGSTIFTGARGDMPGIYAALDMLVLPSRKEALPMCILEAMAAGKPVIATRTGGVPALVRPGSTGELVMPGDVAALGAAIARLLEKPELRMRLGRQARAMAEAEFSAAAMARQYLELYGEAASTVAKGSSWAGAMEARRP